MIFNTNLISIVIPVWIIILAATSCSFIITFYGVPSIVRISNVLKLFDKPDNRKNHLKPVPTLGGVAIFAGVILSSVLFSSLTTAQELKYIVAGMIIIFFIGIKDDLIPMVVYKKFLGQLAATFFIVVPGDIRITGLHGLFGVDEIGYWLSIVITFLIFLTLINSFNLIDGIDGLASGVGIVTSFAFGVWFILADQVSYAVFSFSLLGALIAFIRFNLFSTKYKTFLGDTGSMLIGLLIAVFLVRFMVIENIVSGLIPFKATPAITLAIVIVPVFDTLRIVTIRLINGKSPFYPDRNHIHHRLLKLTNSHIISTSIILAFNIAFIALAYFLQNLGNVLLIPIILVLATIISYIPAYILCKRSKSLHCANDESFSIT